MKKKSLKLEFLALDLSHRKSYFMILKRILAALQKHGAQRLFNAGVGLLQPKSSLRLHQYNTSVGQLLLKLFFKLQQSNATAGILIRWTSDALAEEISEFRKMYRKLVQFYPIAPVNFLANSAPARQTHVANNSAWPIERQYQQFLRICSNSYQCY